ncbi:MAG: AAA family ATPase [Aeriscardovia sp.]|nr:AAA family ATPase [Aeriscardovia sp.]
MTNSGAGKADPYGSEQKKVDLIYGRFDELKSLVTKRLSSTRAQKELNLTSMTERDSFATMYEDRLSSLRAGEYRLVFGKLRMKDGSERYIGRMGLLENEKPILLDWRAKAASPFYEATFFDDMGAALRRHITLENRRVVKLEDELLDLSPEKSEKALKEGILSGEGALMAALEESRTGKMGDIVSTIQREQNRIIRMPLNSTVVVQGGPGTGKSAVALHRAAYLLYTYRKELEASGVLIIGPSQAFVHYIDDVLPCLGETDILIRTMSEMLPGVTVNCKDSPLAAKVKGDLRMVQVIKSAIKRHIRIPRELPAISVNGIKLKLEPEEIAKGQAFARSAGPYEVARRAFVDSMCSLLFSKYEEAAGEQLSGDDGEFVKEQIRENAQVRLALNLSWLPLSARWLLDDLFSKPAKLKTLAPWMSEEEVQSLMREKGKVSEGDIPLLDTAMDLLGEEEVRKKGPSSSRADKEFAKSTMAMFGVSPSLVSASDLLSSLSPSEQKSVVEQAAIDRKWQFGHIIVDEAQELTAMQWRMLRKRSASKSFTIVGDVAQTSSLAGTRSWKKSLSPVFGRDWTLCPLEIDYRNPREVVEEASQFAKKEGLNSEDIKAVRSVEGSLEKVESEDIEKEAVSKLVECAKKFIHSSMGTVALITEKKDVEKMSARVNAALEKEFGKAEADRLTRNGWKSQIAVRGTEEIKGIEYDAVVLMDPPEPEGEGEERKIAASRLYIAMTRPTQKLVIVKKKNRAFI